MTGKYYQIRDEEESLKKKKKSKKEAICDVFKQNGVSLESFEQFKDSNDQVIVIDLLGRLLWKNETFSAVNLKCDDDLLESISLDYGFEVFQDGFEIIMKDLPTEYTISTIEFVIFNIFNI